MLYYPATYPIEREKILKDLFLFLLDKEIRNKIELFSLIREFLKQKKIKDFFPKIWHLNFVYQRYFLDQLPVNENLNRLTSLFQVVSIRSLSGIVPLSVFTRPKNSCPFHCVYCSLVENAPKSYFPDEAAVMRAIRANYDPYQQTFDRLVQFYLSGHPIDKVEVIIQGGTFSFYPKDYREWFVKRVFDALNTNIKEIIQKGKTLIKESTNLKEAQKLNKTSFSRMVGLTIETRPDMINEKEIIFLRELGVTRVELGVQTLNDQILTLVKRGHNVKTVVFATKLLREAGFKITYHLMPGLPGSSFQKDITMLKQVFEDQRFRPDNIKFYPTQVVKNSTLAQWFKEGKFKPIDEPYLWRLTEKFKKEIVPSWVRINRLVRDLTKNDLVVETFPSNFRQNLERYLKKKKVKCPCIRCREIRNKPIIGEVKINMIEYLACDGKEFFIEVVDEQYQLLGYLRLRLPNHTLEKKSFFLKELVGAAIIRELHVLGEVVPLTKKGKIQHQGLGKILVKKAESVSRELKIGKIAVIAAVGVREYYRKLGFYLAENGYMIKKLTQKPDQRSV